MNTEIADPLLVSAELLGIGCSIPVTVLPDARAVVKRFASDFLAEYRRAISAGRKKVVFIVPVGPVGQYEIIADACNSNDINLRDLVIICMDEFVSPAGNDLLSVDDPLSFRGHLERKLYRRLRPELAPPTEQRLNPDPNNLDGIREAISRYGGVDVCFGGIGINGHIAFNDPPEAGDDISIENFGKLATRKVQLSRETRLINAIMSCSGNVDRIPREAVTVGMKEILESSKIQMYMHRPWHSAIVRKVLHGHVTPAVPASLLQTHPDVKFTIADFVTELPEPKLL